MHFDIFSLSLPLRGSFETLTGRWASPVCSASGAFAGFWLRGCAVRDQRQQFPACWFPCGLVCFARLRAALFPVRQCTERALRALSECACVRVCMRVSMLCSCIGGGRQEKPKKNSHLGFVAENRKSGGLFDTIPICKN